MVLNPESLELVIAMAIFLLVFLTLWAMAYILLQVLTPENLMQLGKKYFDSVLNQTIPYQP
ncbi:MAG: hypothetical protein QXE85_00115 [Nitrososphaerota archaeon]